LKTARQRAYYHFLKPGSVQNALYNIINFKAVQELTTTKNESKQRQREGKEKAKRRQREGKGKDKGALREEEGSWRRLGRQ
jgi:hypothetical protein